MDDKAVRGIVYDVLWGTIQLVGSFLLAWSAIEMIRGIGVYSVESEEG